MLQRAGTGRQGPPSSGVPGPGDRSAAELVRAVIDDVTELVRKQIELAKQETVEALVARGVAGAALAMAAVLGLLALTFLGLAAAAALDLVLPAWAAALVVAVAFLILAGVAALVGRARLRQPPAAPTRTVRTLKEDAAWARAQIRR